MSTSKLVLITTLLVIAITVSIVVASDSPPSYKEIKVPHAPGPCWTCRDFVYNLVIEMFISKDKPYEKYIEGKADEVQVTIYDTKYTCEELVMKDHKSGVKRRECKYSKFLRNVGGKTIIYKFWASTFWETPGGPDGYLYALSMIMAGDFYIHAHVYASEPYKAYAGAGDLSVYADVCELKSEDEKSGGNVKSISASGWQRYGSSCKWVVNKAYASSRARLDYYYTYVVIVKAVLKFLDSSSSTLSTSKYSINVDAESTRDNPVVRKDSYKYYAYYVKPNSKVIVKISPEALIINRNGKKYMCKVDSRSKTINSISSDSEVTFTYTCREEESSSGTYTIKVYNDEVFKPVWHVHALDGEPRLDRNDVYFEATYEAPDTGSAWVDSYTVRKIVTFNVQVIDNFGVKYRVRDTLGLVNVEDSGSKIFGPFTYEADLKVTCSINPTSWSASAGDEVVFKVLCSASGMYDILKAFILSYDSSKYETCSIEPSRAVVDRDGTYTFKTNCVPRIGNIKLYIHVIDEGSGEKIPGTITYKIDDLEGIIHYDAKYPIVVSVSYGSTVKILDFDPDIDVSVDILYGKYCTSPSATSCRRVNVENGFKITSSNPNQLLFIYVKTIFDKGYTVTIKALDDSEKREIKAKVTYKVVINDYEFVRSGVTPISFKVPRGSKIIINDAIADNLLLRYVESSTGVKYDSLPASFTVSQDPYIITIHFMNIAVPPPPGNATDKHIYIVPTEISGTTYYTDLYGNVLAPNQPNALLPREFFVIALRVETTYYIVEKQGSGRVIIHPLRICFKVPSTELYSYALPEVRNGKVVNLKLTSYEACVTIKSNATVWLGRGNESRISGKFIILDNYTKGWFGKGYLTLNDLPLSTFVKISYEWANGRDTGSGTVDVPIHIGLVEPVVKSLNDGYVAIYFKWISGPYVENFVEGRKYMHVDAVVEDVNLRLSNDTIMKVINGIETPTVVVKVPSIFSFNGSKLRLVPTKQFYFITEREVDLLYAVPVIKCRELDACPNGFIVKAWVWKNNQVVEPVSYGKAIVKVVNLETSESWSFEKLLDENAEAYVTYSEISKPSRHFEVWVTVSPTPESEIWGKAVVPVKPYLLVRDPVFG